MFKFYRPAPKNALRGSRKLPNERERERVRKEERERERKEEREGERDGG